MNQDPKALPDHKVRRECRANQGRRDPREIQVLRVLRVNPDHRVSPALRGRRAHRAIPVLRGRKECQVLRGHRVLRGRRVRQVLILPAQVLP